MQTLLYFDYKKLEFIVSCAILYIYKNIARVKRLCDSGKFSYTTNVIHQILNYFARIGYMDRYKNRLRR